MEDKHLITELEAFDFSCCHPVREKLLAQLLDMQRQDHRGKKSWPGCMSEAELDLVAAAGNPGVLDYEQKKIRKNKDIRLDTERCIVSERKQCTVFAWIARIFLP